jgi:hypothetical protein
METKDIIIYSAVIALVGYSLYRKYVKKQGEGSPKKSTGIFTPRGNLRDQPDDYEPYGGKKNGE